MTTTELKKRIKTELRDSGLPHKPRDVARVWEYYQEPMYGSEAADDIMAAIDDAMEMAMRDRVA